MFCENCGTRVEDGQPFCPNCGKRMGAPASNAAPSNTGYGAPTSSRPVRPVSNSGGLLGKFNAMQGLEKIFYPVFGCLLVVCYILSFIRIFDAGILSVPMAFPYPIWALIITTLLGLSIAFFVLDYFDKISFKWVWYAIAGATALVFILFVIIWPVSGAALTAGGWFALIFQFLLAGCAVFLMLEKRK